MSPANAPDTAPILLAGCGRTLLAGLAGHRPPRSVVVLESAATIADTGVEEFLAGVEVVRELVPVQGELPIEPEHIAAVLDGRGPFAGVVPGLEYGVLSAAALSDFLGLPGATQRAARCMRDKALLRRVTTEAGVDGPRWCEVGDLDGFRAALAELPGPRHVLKPVDASASRGVVRMAHGDDPAAVWESALASARRADHHGTRYLVEQCVEGPEVSVEMLVRDGETVFWNVTEKHVLDGPHPVETGHIVPGRIGGADLDVLAKGTEKLVQATGFRNGTLHSEWILADGRASLIECAGRLAGDRITDLVSLAYGEPFIARYVSLMAGEPVAFPERAQRAAAIRYFLPAPGVVAAVRGEEAARAVPGVEEVAVELGVDRVVRELTSSFDRVGHVLCVGADAAAAWETAGRAVGEVVFDTEV